MGFPDYQVPVDYIHEEGNHKWAWTGVKWKLLPIVSVLDDLDDVELQDRYKESDPKFFTINADPTPVDGYGRYMADLDSGFVTFNRYDSQGNSAIPLYSELDNEFATHKIALYDSTNTLIDEVQSIIEIKTQSPSTVAFTYENPEVVEKVYNYGVQARVVITVVNYKTIADGVILNFDEETQKWVPEYHEHNMEDIDGGGGGGDNGGSGGGSGNITLGPQPPLAPDFEDIWVDSNNFYMYIWTSEEWVAVTGPGGGTGGGLMNDSRITLLSSRGLEVTGTGGDSFTLNQPTDQLFNIVPKSITTLDSAPPSAARENDLWVDSNDMVLYVYSGEEWIALTGDHAGQKDRGTDIPCEIDGGNSGSVYCDDQIRHLRPGVIVGDTPPLVPSVGDLWFDSNMLELKTWYVTPKNQGKWVSTIHPARSYTPPDNAAGDEIMIQGIAEPTQLEPETYVVKLSDNIKNSTYTLIWSTSDLRDKIQGQGTDTIQVTFAKSGPNFVRCICETSYGDGYYEDILDVVTVSAPPVTHQVTVQNQVDINTGQQLKRFYIDGKPRPYLVFNRDREYIFDQSHISNVGFDLKFFEVDGENKTYYDSDEITVGNQTITIKTSDDTPSVLFYDILESNPNYQGYLMGNKIYSTV